MSIHRKRIESELLSCINSVLREERTEWSTLLSCTECRLGRDLRSAKVYWTYMSLDNPNPEQKVDKELKKRVEDFFEQSLSRIKNRIKSTVRLKFLPELTFVWDQSIAYAARIDSLLDNN